MRRLLLLLLALGLWQITYAQIHCAFETEDSDEACCELCHLSSLTPIRLHRPSADLANSDVPLQRHPSPPRCPVRSLAAQPAARASPLSLIHVPYLM